MMKIWKWVWQRKIALLAGGLIVCLLLSWWTADKSYQVRLSFVYPGVEDGLYPDGQRLLRNDLIADEHVEFALAEMNKRGWYKGITAKHVTNNLRVSENLTDLVQDRVNALRAEGKEFSYYNSEYVLSFSQPRVLYLKDSESLFGLMREDRSKEFVEFMVRSIMNSILAEHAEGEVFSEFCEYMQLGDADFSHAVAIYSDKAQLCINYLNKKCNLDNTFVSSTTGMSFADLVTGFETLQSVRIERLRKYSESEHVTNSLQEFVNGLLVDIETQRLLEVKKADEQIINQKAMLEYDHTFSENIIIVAVNEENGLYQARPKTAYDTVTQQTLNAGVASVNAGNAAENYERLIGLYTDSMSADNAADKVLLAQGLLADIEAEYKRLCDLSVKTIADYLLETNNYYISTSEVESGGIGLGGIIKLGIYFGFGVVLAAALCALAAQRRSKRKEKTEGRGA